MRAKIPSRARIKVNAVIERDREGIYFGVIRELPGCHTQAKSLDELRKRIREAIRLYLQAEHQPTATCFQGRR